MFEKNKHVNIVVTREELEAGFPQFVCTMSEILSIAIVSGLVDREMLRESVKDIVLEVDQDAEVKQSLQTDSIVGSRGSMRQIDICVGKAGEGSTPLFKCYISWHTEPRFKGGWWVFVESPAENFWEEKFEMGSVEDN
jgi:hypothetical protein